MFSISKSLPIALQKKINELVSSDLKANKKLGQHFLSDPQICDQIALSCGSLSNAAVLEIGPGTGNLTQSILALHEGVELTAIETDSRFFDILHEIGVYYKGCKLKVVRCDALQYDFHTWAINNSHKKKYIIANLPYNIGTELLFKWLNENFLKRIQNITVMLQKEVVNRITALHHSKSYCWLSIISQLLCDTELLFDVPIQSFTPEPKVISSVVSFRPLATTYPHDFEKLKIICKTLFLHRRKTIKSIIKNNQSLNYLLHIINDLRIDYKTRPEALDIKTLCRLSIY